MLGFLISPSMKLGNIGPRTLARLDSRAGDKLSIRAVGVPLLASQPRMLRPLSDQPESSAQTFIFFRTTRPAASDRNRMTLAAVFFFAWFKLVITTMARKIRIFTTVLTIVLPKMTGGIRPESNRPRISPQIKTANTSILKILRFLTRNRRCRSDFPSVRTRIRKLRSRWLTERNRKMASIRQAALFRTKIPASMVRLNPTRV